MTKLFQLLIIFILVGCSNKTEQLFEKLSESKTNIDFKNELLETKNLSILDYLYYYNGGGVSLGDINNDGLCDVYFTSNQGKNKLYLNKGDNKFEDISVKANVEGQSDWDTGSIMADVNGDGFLDIYVCAVVGINGFEGYNQLFINNKDATFTESAGEYGLDLDNYSSSAAFLDFDLDGDLDMYLLNHAVHTEASFGNANIREKRSYECGDKLFQNNNGKFEDISEKAGIFGGANGYGLGLAVSDFNADGYPDIYVGNDFHEDDYYYLNNGNGTFTECLKQYFGHTSKFTMGIDVADINHDGFTDLLSLDMLPENEAVLKSSLGDDNVQMMQFRTKKLGYHYQFARNNLQINQAGKFFTETALLSGIAATDWSWSALFADYNQDGEQDLFVGNGIPKRPNDLDYVKYFSNDQIKSKISTTKLLDKQALKKMPDGKVTNYIFEGSNNLVFKNQSNNWIENDSIITNGSAYGDLDNDGDLDIVTNNLNNIATVYNNKTNGKANYLKVKLQFVGKNTFGIGTRVIAYAKGMQQTKELQSTRGFQSSSEPILHFGFANTKTIDSLVVVWPDRTYQSIKNVAVNQNLVVKAVANRKNFDYKKLHPNENQIFTKVDNNLGINFVHQENDYTDFLFQKLMPYQRSDRAQATTIADINNDGKQDVFFGGTTGFPSATYLQTTNGFVKTTFQSFESETNFEDASVAIADFNNDKVNDIFLGSGSGENSSNLQDRLFFGKANNFAKATLPITNQNTSVVKTCDYDLDGDLDVFVGNNSYNNKFGSMPDSFLLNNNQGVFTKVQTKIFEKIGMVTSAIFTDFNNDKKQDLIIVGEWMSPKFFENKNGIFKDVTATKLPEKTNGLYQAIEQFDIDNDGDQDYLLANWGTNSKFKASPKFPMQMYFDDFDKNDTFETIVTIEKNGQYYTTLGYDELAEQFSGMIKKKFNSYKSFAGKPVSQIFDQNLLSKATFFEVHNLQSGYLQNNQGIFTFVPFDNRLQVAPINCFVKSNFDKDANNEVFAAGNYFGVTPFQGRFDGFPGAIIKNQKNIKMVNNLGINLSQKAVRNANIISINNKQYLLLTVNNKATELYEINNN